MADPIRGIQLVGSPSALPPDLAAKAAQAAVAQQLAQALLIQSMTQESPIVHTGGSNPFARDVPNLAPLGKIFQSYMGSKQLGDASNTLQQLAIQGEQRRQGDLAASMGDIPEQATPATYSPGEGYDVTPAHAATSRDMALRLLLSSSPENQALGSLLANRGIETEQKNAIDAQGLGRMFSSGVDPATIPDMTGKGIWTGMNMLTNPSGARLMPKVSAYKVGEVPIGVQASALGGATPPAGAAPTAWPGPPGQGSAQMGPGNQTQGTFSKVGGTDVFTDPEGQAHVLPTAGSDASKNVVDYFTGKEGVLPEGKKEAMAFQKDVPIIQNMLDLSQSAGTGITADWKLKARKFAKDTLGVSDDTSNKIVDLETLMKYALTPATQAGRAFNSRVTQLEFTNFMKAYGADPTVDPGTMVNIFTNMLTAGFNQSTQHQANVKAASAIPDIGDKAAGSFSVPLDPEKILGEAYGKSQINMRMDQDQTTGMWRNFVGKPGGAAAPAPAAAPQVVPRKGGGVAYAGKIVGGKQTWWSSAEEAQQSLAQ